MKAAAVATGKEHGISKRTVERSFAKATPKPKAVNRSERGHTIMKRPLRSKSGPVYSARGIDAARQHYLRHAELIDDLDAEQEIVIDALREIAGKRSMRGAQGDDLDVPDFLRRKRDSQDGRSETPPDDPTPENSLREIEDTANRAPGRRP